MRLAWTTDRTALPPATIFDNSVRVVSRRGLANPGGSEVGS
jgi:hypothetical protein